jgi:cobalamin biosynthetic protein CobC
MDGQDQGIGDAPDHGGGIDAAALRYGGRRAGWLDLSTGINPVPFPIPPLPPEAWTALPDRAAARGLTEAARALWSVPEGAAILAAPGASALIARIPALAEPGRVAIPGPTYNEHARAFAAAGWTLADSAAVRVIVHPNNPDGRLWTAAEARGDLVIIDESFADTCPEASLIALAARPGVIILKSFGKFWGLAGLRLGFAIGDPRLIARLETLLGPWPVSGAAQAIGTAALQDRAWAGASRQRLARDAARLDAVLAAAGATALGGTDLFRLYDTPDAGLWQDRLARRQIWTRVFPYSRRWLRLGLPGTAEGWARLEAAL